MTVYEPTGWRVECDGSGCWSVGIDAYDHDEQELLDSLRREGWIVTVDSLAQWCSLDCFIQSRQSKSVRESHAREAKAHVEDHSHRCCRDHGTHATTGWHSWRDCPTPFPRRIEGGDVSTTGTALSDVVGHKLERTVRQYGFLFNAWGGTP